MLRIENLTFGWKQTPLFEQVNCQLSAGEMVLLKGENGTGKTTLLQLAAGMIPHFTRGEMLTGDIYLNERSIFQFPPKSFFPQIGYVPGKNLDFFLLNDNLTEEIALIQAVLQLPATELNSRKERLMEIFPEIRTLLKVGFGQMTQIQKIISLTAIFHLQGARLWLFDEALSAASPEFLTQWNDFFELKKRSGCALILSGHNLNGLNRLPVWEIKSNRIYTGIEGRHAG